MLKWTDDQLTHFKVASFKNTPSHNASSFTSLSSIASNLTSVQSICILINQAGSLSITILQCKNTQSHVIPIPLQVPAAANALNFPWIIPQLWPRLASPLLSSPLMNVGKSPACVLKYSCAHQFGTHVFFFISPRLARWNELKTNGTVFCSPLGTLIQCNVI